jgi:hypothetical protein
VITLRAGVRNGTLLQIDEFAPDVSNSMPARSAGFFGGGTPTVDTDRVVELKAFNFEMSDRCKERMHQEYVSKYIDRRNTIRIQADGSLHLETSMPPPPPPPARWVNEPAHKCSRHVPHVHTIYPHILENKGGTYPGTNVENRAAFHRGEWTVTFVVAGNDEDTISRSYILDGNNQYWGGMMSAVGSGSQLRCGQEDGGGCGGGSEIDRGGNCAKEQLFGSNDRWFCQRNRCPWIVATGAGPRQSDIWCRAVRYEPASAASQCPFDASLFCHVITVRVGRRQGSYLKVDAHASNSNTNTLPDRQATWLGGDTPNLDTDRLRELVMYDFEFDDECVEWLHESFMSRYRVPTPPPPPPMVTSDCSGGATQPATELRMPGFTRKQDYWCVHDAASCARTRALSFC